MIQSDLIRWGKLPVGMSGRISIKMNNTLPRMNFCVTMIPLPPPRNYWDMLHRSISQFIWKGKTPRIKLADLQRKTLKLWGPITSEF